MHKAIISVLQRCEGRAKGNAIDVRMEHSAETVRTGRFSWHSSAKSNRSSANSANSKGGCVQGDNVSEMQL